MPRTTAAIQVSLWRRRRSLVTFRWLVLLLAVSMALAGCGGSTSQGDGTTKNRAATQGTVSAVSDRSSGLSFPRQPPSKNDGMAPSAFTVGRLSVQDGCIRVKYRDRDRGDLVVWPSGYSLSKRGGEILILNEKGKVAAQVGDKVRMGGGEITKSEAGGTPEEAKRNYDEKRRRMGVPAQCPGPLWMASEVRQVKRG